ncbi:MAG: ActS/PrrB/RegB family redox-sensitive histidine kinase, partial [Pseudomonadota bacterium]
FDSLMSPAVTTIVHRDAALTLLFDLGQLGGLLYITGGLANPFAVMMLAQTIISATALTLRTTLLIGSATAALILFLANSSLPLIRHDGSRLDIDPLLVAGSAVALIISVLFLGGYARRVTMEALAMSEALTATQLALEREQKLTDLGGVVAAAAHELGTPLATIKLVSSELYEELAERPLQQEDAALIGQQADRCRDILAAMGRGAKEDAHVRFAPFSAVVAEAAEPHLDRGIEVRRRVRGMSGDTPRNPTVSDEPDISRRPELIHGVRNLVQNAVDFAASTVWIDVDWDEARLILRVGDDGEGYPSDLIGRIGDPFVRRRSPRERRDLRPGYDGMGLGLFIAKTLLERTGAQLTFANGVAAPGNARAARPTGAIVEAIWPRGALDVSRDISRGPLGENKTLEES